MVHRLWSLRLRSTPTPKEGWNSPGGPWAGSVVRLPPYLHPANDRLQNALALSLMSSQNLWGCSQDQIWCPYRQRGPMHSQQGLSIVKRPPYIQHTQQHYIVLINTQVTEHAIEHTQAASGRGDECEESRQTAGLTVFYQRLNRPLQPPLRSMPGRGQPNSHT